MTAKRFKFNGRNNCIEYDGKSILLDSYGEDIEELLNELNDENEQLKFQLQNTYDQRDEFHRGARENANRVGKLEKENEQLRHDATILIQSNQDYRKENEQLKERINELQKESYGNLDGLNYYQEQNGHLSSKISDLECENEQLKKDILRLMYTAEHLVNIKKLEEKWNIDYNQFHSDLINGDEHL